MYYDRYCILKQRGEAYNFIFDCGYSMSTTAMSLDDGKEMVHCIWLYHIIFQCHAALDQFRKGLCETLQFGHLMSTYAEEAWGLLAASAAFNVNADYFLFMRCICNLVF